MLKKARSKANQVALKAGVLITLATATSLSQAKTIAADADAFATMAVGVNDFLAGGLGATIALGSLGFGAYMAATTNKIASVFIPAVIAMGVHWGPEAVVELTTGGAMLL